MYGSAGFGVTVFNTTVDGPFADTVTPSRKADAICLMFSTRFKEKTTSAAVTRAPSLNRARGSSLNVNVRASFETVYDFARSGSGWLTLPPLKVRRVS